MYAFDRFPCRLQLMATSILIIKDLLPVHAARDCRSPASTSPGPLGGSPACIARWAGAALIAASLLIFLAPVVALLLAVCGARPLCRVRNLVVVVVIVTALLLHVRAVTAGLRLLQTALRGRDVRLELAHVLLDGAELLGQLGQRGQRLQRLALRGQGRRAIVRRQAKVGQPAAAPVMQHALGRRVEVGLVALEQLAVLARQLREEVLEVLRFDRARVRTLAWASLGR